MVFYQLGSLIRWEKNQYKKLPFQRFATFERVGLQEKYLKLSPTGLRIQRIII